MADSPDPSKPQLVPPLPSDVKSVSTATPIVQRPDSFASKVAAADVAQGNVKQAAISEAAAKQADPPASQTGAATPEPPAAPLSRTDKLRNALEKFVSVKELNDSSQHFSHLGMCTKCGWQTYQHSDNDARTLVRQHVQQHWRDVTAEVNAA